MIVGRIVAALYIDPRGPYPAIEGVECWDETRDARLYDGPHPVVAHPPCGPWGRLRHMYRGDQHDCGPRAVSQVQTFGGALEHPERSLLWQHMGLPAPGDATDCHGGRTYEVDQCDWGHVARKRTWLYVVRVDQWRVMAAIRRRRGTGVATHQVSRDAERARRNGYTLLRCSPQACRRTPPALAEWLVSIARGAQITGEEQHHATS